MSDSDPSPHAPPQRNRLGDETSIYLRQHRDNPVDWYPWGPEALERARVEDKPLLISIGYSACHWCHVMAHESFEDPATADQMNRDFINIKVDREERPDVDQIYMDTVVRLAGHGGWPLTVFCTPDGRPFYGGTYFPPEPRHGMPSFRDVLQAVERAYRSERVQIEDQAAQILRALRQRPTGVASELPGRAALARAAEQLLANADPNLGGFGAAPKFPTPTNLDLLLTAAEILPDADAKGMLEHVVFTCREMSRGGVYDQLGGGFHRYSVDAEWRIPHFEKMLYDEGQLIRTYADAWRQSGDDELLWPVRETADFLIREMTAEDGGFFASQDADSEGVEGKFYAWTPTQVEAVLGSDSAHAFCGAYDVTPSGTFEGDTSVLHDVARETRNRWAAEREALLKARSSRIPPATDRKRIAAWNGLAISGLARASSILGDAAMRSAAIAAADFVLNRMVDGEERLLRIFDAGRARIPAFLDDHAAMLEATLDLHRAGAGDRFLHAALRLATAIAERFFDANEGDLFLTPADGEALVHRPRSDHDGATPHSAGLAALGLVRIAALTGRRELARISEVVLRNHAWAIERAPSAFPTLIRAAVLAERGPTVVVIAGESASASTLELADCARRTFAPEDAVLIASPAAELPREVDPFWLAERRPVEGRAAAYVCRGTTCSLPVTTAEELATLAAPPR